MILCDSKKNLVANDEEILSSRDIYLSLSISRSLASKFFRLAILLAIWFTIKSPAASAVNIIALFEAVLRASVADF